MGPERRGSRAGDSSPESPGLSQAAIESVLRRMDAEPPVDEALAEEHGLSTEEFAMVREFLGRLPTFTELGIVSALFSEHCSYKSSRVWLREFPTAGKRVVLGPGENAGVVDIGHGLVAAFKMESHNHPSFIEPYQGAATGVGGILRDVFTMGARPIAAMNALRFGEIDAPRMRHLVDGVVRGIGDYGNCVGIPTVGGETGFHKSYNGNILVNAFALGVCRRDEIFLGRAAGVGNPILYVGSRTGRDGIHGATMASESFDEESETKRPTVQVGDPFTEKVLLEACLEAMKSGAIVGIPDMGAAALTSSAFEMAARAGSGIEIDLERVPLREPGLTPYELMLSESQERMVIVAERGREEEVAKVFVKWGLEVSTIGRVAAGERAVLRFGGRVAGDMPVSPLVDGAPRYERAAIAPPDLVRRQEQPEVPEPEDPGRVLFDLLATPELGDKSWIFRQYDSTVRSNTVVGPGGDAALVRIKGTPAALALTCDVNPVYCWLDPRSGGRQAVAEAARNLACVGAQAIALTDCLNFGNPQRPEVAWQLRECIRGMAEACSALEVPVVSGNVSLYNETEGRGIHPTPSVAMVGLIEELRADAHATGLAAFRHAGDRVLLLGSLAPDFGGSAYLRLLFDVEQGLPPRVDLEHEAALARLLRELFAAGTLSAAHDVSNGGLAVALAEMTFRFGLGARLRLAVAPSLLFAESQGCVVVTCVRGAQNRILERAQSLGVPANEIGEVGGERLEVGFAGGKIEPAVADLRQAWATALPRSLGL